MTFSFEVAEFVPGIEASLVDDYTVQPSTLFFGEVDHARVPICELILTAGARFDVFEAVNTAGSSR